VKRTAPPKRTKTLSRQSAGLKRASRMKPIGKRGREDRQSLRESAAKVLAWSGGRCERCRNPQELVGPLQVHHRLMRSQGGGHEPSNLAALCSGCHKMIHDHLVPDWPKWIVTRKGAA